MIFSSSKSWATWMQVQKKRHLVEPECFLKTRSVSSTWELVRNVETQTPSQTYLIQIFVLEVPFAIQMHIEV